MASPTPAATPTLEDQFAATTTELAVTKAELKRTRAALVVAQQHLLSAELIKRHIIKLAAITPAPPTWLVAPITTHPHAPGVPSVLLSDWHWGERVDPAQVDGVNKYDLATARARAKTLVVRTVDLLTNHMVSPRYPGLVVPLGGDMVSGNIHEELTATNERPIMAVVTDLYGVLVKVLEEFVYHFGRVFVPCVTGNHGRTTRQPVYKDRVYTSYDWLLYQLLAKHFEGDKRYAFLISDGSDAYYKVYHHRYLLTHGDQFHGGDGMVGPLGPIIRGDYKKRGRNIETARPYDTLLLGHWHTLLMLRRVIVNSSLKGYCEYAHGLNLPVEPPQQALWFTHPHHGLTVSMPVLVETTPRPRAIDWVSVPAVLPPSSSPPSTT